MFEILRRFLAGDEIGVLISAHIVDLEFGRVFPGVDKLAELLPVGAVLDRKSVV